MVTRLIRILLLPLALVAAAPAAAQTTDAILDSLQYGAFRYAWDEANPANGMIKDRSQPGSPASIAAVGFGLSVICTGVDHGWVSRAAARTRVRTTLETFWTKPQSSAASGTIGNQGWFYHFLDMNTALRMVSWDTELSTIDTALLLAGILDAKQYFGGGDADEVQIRALADSIYRRVNFPFMVNASGKRLRHGWRPGSGFIPFDWVGYNEAMILYILAFGSPTKPVPLIDIPTSWQGWTSGYNWSTQYGQTYVVFPPLFGHQYSHCWIDFRGIQDAFMRGKGIDYFENSRRATLAQRAYAVANPGGHVGYSDSLWGFTASDDPSGYAAHGAPPPQSENGTITPTAPISSLPFAPEAVIPTIRNLYMNYKLPYTWGPYGFKDAFNLDVAWFGPDVLGIDQGPIGIMIENYRTGAVWERFMNNPEIITGLQRAGFTGQPLSVEDGRPAGVEFGQVTPNPFHDSTTLDFRLASATRVRLAIYDIAGRRVAVLVDEIRAAGQHQATLRAQGLPSGVYLARLEVDGQAIVRHIALVR
jgi:hypothetical protein